jgi:hypothetical protein
MLTIHKNFTEYTNFLNEFKSKWKDIGTVETFLVPLAAPIPKNISFKNVIKLMSD